MTANWTVRARRFTLRSLRASALPDGAALAVRRAGRGCPLRSKTISATGPALDLRGVVGGPLGAGQALEAAVTAM